MVSVRTQPLANLTCATARRLPSDEGDSISFRNILKVCAEADWVRLIGYCMKDKGLAHFLSVHVRPICRVSSAIKMTAKTRPKTIFESDYPSLITLVVTPHQVPNRCGYLAAGWACMLRHPGDQLWMRRLQARLQGMRAAHMHMWG